MIKQVKRGKQTLSPMPLSSRDREENGWNIDEILCHSVKVVTTHSLEQDSSIKNINLTC